MIRGTDLMIGDWISYGGKPVQVLQLSRTEYEGFEPIPLTPEILERNFPEPTDGLTWYPEEGGFNCHTYVPKCEINAFGLFKYVHQLQHALRLCGIDLEIKL